jgi:hypothetical protein
VTALAVWKCDNETGLGSAANTTEALTTTANLRKQEPIMAELKLTCSVESCTRPAKGKREWCGMHTERWRRWGDPTFVKPREFPSTFDRRVRRYKADDACSIQGCEGTPLARGWCQLHYGRWTKHGDPQATTWRSKPAAERLRDRVVIGDGGCWELHGTRNSSGYAWHTVNGRKVLAHRFSYESFVGPIPLGLEIDHLCRNRICCNPEHLEPVTRVENLARSRQSNRGSLA